MTKLVGLSWIVIGSLSAGSSQAEGVVTGSGGGFEPLGPMTVGAGGATAAVTGGAALDVVDPFDVDPSLPAAAGPPVVDLGRMLGRPAAGRRLALLAVPPLGRGAARCRVAMGTSDESRNRSRHHRACRAGRYEHDRDRHTEPEERSEQRAVSRSRSPALRYHSFGAPKRALECTFDAGEVPTLKLQTAFSDRQ